LLQGGCVCFLLLRPLLDNLLTPGCMARAAVAAAAAAHRLRECSKLHSKALQPVHLHPVVLTCKPWQAEQALDQVRPAVTAHAAAAASKLAACLTVIDDSTAAAAVTTSLSDLVPQPLRHQATAKWCCYSERHRPFQLHRRGVQRAVEVEPPGSV
jgi:hypothetical protein